jgi:hypothetical protein
MDGKWNHKIFSVNEESFSSVALGIFRFQYANNPVYKAYVQALAIDPGKIDSVYDIPFLPISFLKRTRSAQHCLSRRLFLKAAELQGWLPAAIISMILVCTRKVLVKVLKGNMAK